MLVAVAVAFVAANTVNALHKGGDYLVYLESGRRVLDGTPMYAGSGAGAGVIGPPFQAVLFVPFAALARSSEPAARLVWYAVNLLLLAWGIVWWVRALAPALDVRLTPRGIPLEASRLLLPLVAIAFPLQTNFEHQNLNVVLLALTGKAADAAAAQRSDASAVLVGIAAAIKAFPAALLLWFAVQRMWRALAIGASTALVLTLLPALRYGIDGYLAQFRDWMAISGAGGWPIRENNQSLFAMLARWFGPPTAAAEGHLAPGQHPWIHFGWFAVVVVVFIAFAFSASRWRVGWAPLGFAAALAAGVVASPIAWDHYWVLLFPAFFVSWNVPGPALARPVFWAGAIGTSGFSRATVGVRGLRLAREVSTFTWAALLLLALVLVVGLRMRGAEPGDSGGLGDLPEGPVGS